MKVLDFGLAKAMEPAVGSSPNVSQSPTITTPAMMTGVGMILGTAAYMSPEQAKGRAVDKRSDIWAFGAVLYEMLTGERAFKGEDVSDTLAAILRGEPDWTRAAGGHAPPHSAACSAAASRRIASNDSIRPRPCDSRSRRPRQEPPTRRQRAQSRAPVAVKHSRGQWRASPLPRPSALQPGTYWHGR